MSMSESALDELVQLIHKRAPEKDRRIFLGAASKVYGHEGEKRIKELTGIAYSTLHRGKIDAENELKQLESTCEDQYSSDNPHQSK